MSNRSASDCRSTIRAESMTGGHSLQGVDARQTLDLAGPGWRLWLDQDAKWADDELFLPPVDIQNLPVNAPTCGWAALKTAGIAAAIPGTVEEYLHPGNGPQGDIKGVSWWTREISIPAAQAQRRLLLRFDAIRLRAEVFVNRKLIGYDLLGNTPFELDISSAAGPGETIELAVRVTDPGGNFSWGDYSTFDWGKYKIPHSHGFGGIIAPARLISCDPVYLSDIYMQNTPEPTTVNAILTIRNTTAADVRRHILLQLAEASGNVNVFDLELRDVDLAPGENTIKTQIALPAAKLWNIDTPNLYSCHVTILERSRITDHASQTFGFRWFSPAGIGTHAIFVLNSKRIVLRTALNWGFWPVNGIFPTKDMAEKEILTAKALGQNMLNFHRCIGHTISLDAADRLGLLLYEEPGAYMCGFRGGPGDFTKTLVREKLLRMVKRDRSHPSLVIYNMINELGETVSPEILNTHTTDMRDAHAIDPSRTITHTSAWAKVPDAEEQAKMHMRPFDDTVHMKGWFDSHNAGGPECWMDDLYESPAKFYNRTDNRSEIVFWGEEGALSAPPRLDLIKSALQAAPHKGWDGQVYLDWWNAFDSFITRKKLRAAFPTVDALTVAMGNVSLYHQGHKIELMRINDTADGYAVNGWESEVIDNHSGIVDCFRNPKGDIFHIADYNRPFFMSVQPRSHFGQASEVVTVDFFAVNELDIKGDHKLRILIKDPAGDEILAKEESVRLTGGMVYGELVKEAVSLQLGTMAGIYRVEARLCDVTGREIASGYNEVLVVDWKKTQIRGEGATWEEEPLVQNFLAGHKSHTVESYNDDLPALDWLVVTRGPELQETIIPAVAFSKAGMVATYFKDTKFKTPAATRVHATLDHAVEQGSQPDRELPANEGYSVRWEGHIVPEAGGLHGFAINASDGVKLMINGNILFDTLDTTGGTMRSSILLEAGRPASLVVEFAHHNPVDSGHCRLMWRPAETRKTDTQRIMNRVRDDGTTLLILDQAEKWMELIQANAAVKYAGAFPLCKYWRGGQHFIKPHDLFQELPASCAMNWPYQSVAVDGDRRTGLKIEGEELVVGAWHSYPMELGTAVGIIPCGKGVVIFSTLEIAKQLASKEPAAHVARKLMCNFLEFATRRTVV